MKLWIIAIFLTFFALAPAFAAQKAQVGVNGLVCDFCARALEKTFGKRDEVREIDVDLDTKMVTVTFNEGRTINDDELRRIITDSGYAVTDIQRVEDATGANGE